MGRFITDLVLMPTGFSFWVHVIVATSRGDVHHRRTFALDIRTECRRGLTFHNLELVRRARKEMEQAA
jgi:hypothetical protein